MIDEAFPSMPVEILGMNSSAYAGADFSVTQNEEDAKKLVELKKLIALVTNYLLKIRQLYLTMLKIKMN